MIRAAGTPTDDVAKFVKEYKLDYLICIDPTGGNGKGGGPLFAAYRIGELPHAFVVGRDGKVVGHGSLAEVLAAARKLAAEPKAP